MSEVQRQRVEVADKLVIVGDELNARPDMIMISDLASTLKLRFPERPPFNRLRPSLFYRRCTDRIHESILEAPALEGKTLSALSVRNYPMIFERGTLKK